MVACFYSFAEKHLVNRFVFGEVSTLKGMPLYEVSFYGIEIVWFWCDVTVQFGMAIAQVRTDQPGLIKATAATKFKQFPTVLNLFSNQVDWWSLKDIYLFCSCWMAFQMTAETDWLYNFCRCIIDLSKYRHEETHELWVDLEGGAGKLFLLMTITGRSSPELLNCTDLSTLRLEDESELKKKFSVRY